MLKKNQEIELHIDGMSTMGSGVGHYDGLAVFVNNTAVGDTVLCHIIKAKKNYAIGKLVRVISPSEDRTEPDCPVSLRCGGCCYRHVSYDAELRYKEQKVVDAFTRIGHLNVELEPILGSEEQIAYRNKAQYPVADFPGKGPQFGFYATSSHRIVPCMDCRLQPPGFAQVLKIIREWMVRYNISSYDERTHTGLIRHIYLRQGHYSKELMVCLVVNGRNVPQTYPLIRTLRDEVPNFCTFLLNYNTEKTNVILGKEQEVLFGEGFIRDRLLNCTFRVSPQSFYQVNTAQAEVLYRKAAELAGLQPDDILLDLYCGTGTIGLTMADKVKKLYGVEIVPEAIADARRNAAENGITNAEFFCGDSAMASEQLLHDGVSPDVILVDPPRKGLSPDLIRTISEWDPKRVVYVSCDPATLARDCARFQELGWETRRVCPVDMFPRTAHVETVVLMTRTGAGKA